MELQRKFFFSDSFIRDCQIPQSDCNKNQQPSETSWRFNLYLGSHGWDFKSRCEKTGVHIQSIHEEYADRHSSYLFTLYCKIIT